MNNCERVEKENFRENDYPLDHQEIIERYKEAEPRPLVLVCHTLFLESLFGDRTVKGGDE